MTRQVAECGNAQRGGFGGRRFQKALGGFVYSSRRHRTHPCLVPHVRLLAAFGVTALSVAGTEGAAAGQGSALASRPGLSPLYHLPLEVSRGRWREVSFSL